LIDQTIFSEDSTTICRVPINKFSRISTALAFVFIFTSAIAINSQAATVSGTACSQAGNQILEGKKLFTCVKSGSKLSWKYTDDNTSAFAPFPLMGPSWLEIAQQKDLLEKAAFERAAKEAAELKAKRDAEIAAALKARLAEEAKAAKAEAEKPKIQGLVIGKLLWGDDFAGQAGSQASSTSWTPRFCGQAASNGGGTCHNNEQQYYIPEAIAQDGSAAGNLIITTKRITQPPTNAGICYVGLCSFTSGRLDTQGKLSFKYGFIEARIKMPAGSGNWPAFWMLGDNINQVGWPYSGEMDIVEIHSDRPSIVTSATHFSITDTPNTCCGNHRFVFDEVNFGRVDVSSGFHTYAIAWLPNSISYYFDGQLVGSATPSRVSGKWVFNEKFFLILNNAVGSFGGSWANLQSSTMSIDWVRSYQLNGYGEVFTP
jgi:beta-glucanase (GH16 family)